MKENKTSRSFTVGAIALAFLITGYQTALFVHRATVSRIIANRDSPDTVYIIQRQADGNRSSQGSQSQSGNGTRGVRNHNQQKTEAYDTVRRNAAHSPEATKVRTSYGSRRYESFRFNPNTADLDELMRLGFSQKQAQAIINYRAKGGRFRRKEDFAKSYVVADSVYRRLEPYIDIPLLDINMADSAAFDDLPGIGPWLASQMVKHRQELHGYSYKEQILDIYRMDTGKYADIQDLITLSPAPPYHLWTLPEDSLAQHPYIGHRAAQAIIRYRKSTPKSEWSLKEILASNILPPETADKLARCNIAAP